MKPILYQWKPWAIDLGWNPKSSAALTELRAHPYAGPYLLERNLPRLWQRGMAVALFRSRNDARGVLKTLKKRSPDAKIVRVETTLKEI